MKVRQLIEMLQNCNQDAEVRLDDDTYPAVDGCYPFNLDEFDGDAEDAPPENTVLLEITLVEK
jgi:hypothetical protein